MWTEGTIAHAEQHLAKNKRAMMTGVRPTATLAEGLEKPSQRIFGRGGRVGRSGRQRMHRRARPCRGEGGVRLGEEDQARWV